MQRALARAGGAAAPRAAAPWCRTASTGRCFSSASSLAIAVRPLPGACIEASRSFTQLSARVPVRALSGVACAALARWAICRRAASSAACEAQEPAPPPEQITAALLQLGVSADKAQNVRGALAAIRSAVEKGHAQLVVLPEIWNGPYATKSFPEYCEKIPEPGQMPDPKEHPTIFAVSQEAASSKIPIVAGSISERGPNGEVFNTCVVLGPDGRCLARHRKVHLFDIDIPGKMTFRESDTLTAGKDLTTLDLPVAGGHIRVGIGICYDVRFPELSLAMRGRGCQVLIFPGAFNTTTGPMHWSLLMRARAVDTQSFVLACSPSRNPEGYPAWGHSMVVDPRGDILAEAGHEPETVMVQLPLTRVAEVRGQIPVGVQRRHDVYPRL